MALNPGDSLKHLVIGAPLGAGTMGEVYRARDSRLDRDVAVKVLPEGVGQDEEHLVRFEREAKALAALSHPNIAQVYGIGQEEETCFIEMELVPGEDMADRLAGAGVAVEEALDLAHQVACGLEAAHEAGVVHRDVKPANIRVTPVGVAKLLDFGLAKADGCGGSQVVEALHTTERGLVLGTPTYMSPEQLHGSAVDKRTDVWSFGCVLFECLAGAPPFQGASFVELATAISAEEPDWELLPEGLMPEVLWLLERCLTKDARDRLRDIGEARIALRRALTPGAEGGRPRLATTAGDGVRQGEFLLRMESVRPLEGRLPKLLGDTMTYFDNGKASDVLVAFLPGLGLDERSLEPTLLGLPYRAIAVSLYGFGPDARYRPALSLGDHSKLLADFLSDLASRIPASIRVLAAFSSGADQALHLLSGESFDSEILDAALLLSPSPHEETLGISKLYASLPDGEREICRQIATLSSGSDSLEHWIRTHTYLVQAFQKLGSDVGALRSYAAALLRDCLADPDQFFRRFRTADQRLRRLDCVYARGEEATIDYILSRHLAEDALGPLFREERIHLASTTHMFLADPGVVGPYLADIVKDLGAS